MIPYGRHFVDDNDIKSVVDVLKSNWLTCGSTVDLFEKKLAETVDSKYAISCSNGTTALHLALLELGIGKGDIVLVPAITFLASANAVRYVNADVVFVDVDSNTGLMTAENLEKAIKENKSKNLKAVINVHLAGQCEDLEEICKVARKHNLLIIEDAAHAIGTHYISKENNASYPIGSNQYCDLTTFSFHPVKTIAMGEGGAITTNNEKIAHKLKILRSHGMIKESDQWLDDNSKKSPWYYEMHELGYNYRISDINCALGLSQLEKLEQFKKEREKSVKNYDIAFEDLKNIKPLKKLPFSDPAWHLYIIFINFENISINRTNLMNELKKDGIGTQVHYIPLYKQPYYKKLYGDINLEGAEEYYSKCLSLPLYVGLQSEQQNKVIELVKLYAQ